MKQSMLTTTDNPFDPFTQFIDWYRFDVDKGYNSCCLIARLAMTSSDLTDEENRLEIENAINEICKYNLSGVHTKVVKDV